MQYLVEQGSTHREVLERVRARYGDAAKILSQRTIRLGGFLGLFKKEGVELTFYLKDDGAREEEKKKTIIEEEKRQLLEKIKQDRAIEEVLHEVRSLKESITQVSKTQNIHELDHPSLTALHELLSDNDFSVNYTNNLLSRVKAEFSLDELENFDLLTSTVLEWIAEDIKTPPTPKLSRPRTIVLIGPTGVGKTTTIAKLAALNSLGLGGFSAASVRMITIDSYRIGAVEQIEKYAGIMRIPVSVVESAKDLKELLLKHQDTDVILIDTIGKSPKDAVKLAEMQEFLSVCGSHAEVYLVLAATTKTQDMLDIMRQFEPFRYNGLVITKLDETSRPGNVLSAMAETGKTAVWLTDGQKVPQDICAAHPLNFLMNLEGFMLNRPKLEERYGKLLR